MSHVIAFFSAMLTAYMKFYARCQSACSKIFGIRLRWGGIFRESPVFALLPRLSHLTFEPAVWVKNVL